MSHQSQFDSEPGEEAPPIESLKIETPVIDMQDLEHKATPQTRIPNSGVKIEPRFDVADARDLAKEEEAALEALEEFEKHLKQQPPS